MMTPMMTPKEQFARILNAALGNLPTPLTVDLTLQPPALPNVNANYRLAAMLFEFAGEDDSPIAKKLSGPLDVSWLATLAELEGCDRDSACGEHKISQQDYRSGKSKVLPNTKAEFIRRASEQRAMIRQRAQIISTEAQHMAAGCWERALDHLPKFRAKLVEQERAIFAGQPELGTSPLLRMVDALPKLMNCQIEKLKAALGNRRPNQLIPKS